jgi:hypothetical protein
VAGWAVDTSGAHGGFAVAAVAAGGMTLLAVTGLRTRSEPPRREQDLAARNARAPVTEKQRPAQ